MEGPGRQNRGPGEQNGGPGAPKSHFGPFWAFGLIFDAFLEGLEGVLCRKSGQHGPNLGPKIEPKWTKNRCKNRSKIWCILGSIFGRIWKDFGSQNGAMLAPKSIKNRCHLRKTNFWKIIVLLLEKQLFWRFGGPSWEQKSIKHRSKHRVQDGIHLGVGF